MRLWAAEQRIVQVEAFCAGRRHMRADDGRVEHLHEMRPLAQGGERFEVSFEHAAAAQAPEALPDAVPGAELGRQRSPRIGFSR